MNSKVFYQAALRVALYCIFTGLLFLVLWADAYRGSSFNEWSFVEIAQSVLLAILSGMLLYSALRGPALRVSALLLFAFTFSSLIRENDHLLDALANNLWQTLVALVIVPIVFLTWWRRARFEAEMETYVQSTSFGLLIAAILTTYVFARLYGMGDFWRLVLKSNFSRSIKNMSEESVELLGYGILSLAVLEFQRLANRVGGYS